MSAPTNRDDPDPAGDTGIEQQPERRGKRRLSFRARVLILGAGGALIVVGIAGLALPGIQGVLTIALGAALLSVASHPVHRLLKRLLKRWPKLWRKIEAFRKRVLDRFGH